MAEKNFHGEKSFARKKIQNFSYGLQDKIGKGYSSQVYRGKNDSIDEPVAIKVIDLKMLKSQINRILLASEIEILKSMKNMTHILNFHQVYTTKNNAYIITQLCETDLDSKIKKGLTEGEALSYMDQIITGYSHIFKKDLIHRDLKPANLLISKSNEIKIADFGFVVKSVDVVNPSKYNVGSPLYMAPESMRRNQYSFKSDIWALGIILFEMLTGETPWKAKNQKQLLRKIESERIDEVLMRYSFDKQVNKFLSQTLCQDKNQRMKPQGLIQFSFKSPSIGSILEEKSSNIIPQNFSAAYPSSSQKRINYSEKSIEKRMFTVEKTNKVFSQKTPSTHCQNFSIKKFQNTQKNVQNSQKNTYVTTLSSSQRADSMIQKQDKKQISKLLITQVHFCRFLYKMYIKIKQSVETGLFKDNTRIDVLFKCFGKIVSEKMTNLKQFDHFNYVMVDSNKYLQYKNTPDFVKLSKVVKDYYNRYSEQFGNFWHNTDKKAQKQVLFRECIEEVSKSIQFLLINLQEKSNGEFIGDCGRFLNGYSKDIVILDYLITCKQLLQIIDKQIRATGCENYEKFTKKSRIQEIVDGGTSQISLELYEKIIERGRIIVGRI